MKQNIKPMLGKNFLSGKLIVWQAHNANTQNHTPTQRRIAKSQLPVVIIIKFQLNKNHTHGLNEGMNSLLP